MNLILFKGQGPCPACRKVIAELDAAGIRFELNEDNGGLYYAGVAVGAKTRPILMWYAVGAGSDATSIIERFRDE